MSNNGKIGSRLAVCGLGDGGGNVVLAKARVLDRVLERAEACGQARYVSELQSAVRFVFINTNKTSLESHTEDARSILARWPYISIDVFQLGPKTTNGQGTGTVEGTGEEAAKESIADGTLAEFFTRLKVEVVDLSKAFGSGGTGLGSSSHIIRLCRDDLKLLTLPSITAASFQRNEINLDRSEVVRKKLKELDQAGVAYSLLRTTNLYDRRTTKPQAYAMIDRLQALATFGVLRVLVQRTSYDYNDVLRQLYCNAKKEEMGKRWLMAGETLKLSEANNLKAEGWRAIAEKLLQTHVFEFDMTKIGGAMVAFEHVGLSGEAQSDFMSALYTVVNERAGSKGNKNFHPKEVDLPSADPNEVTIRIWAAEYTGIPSVADLPQLSLLSPARFTINVPEVVEPYEEAEEISQNLLPPAKVEAFTPTRAWETLKELLEAASASNPQALGVLNYGQPYALTSQDVQYKENPNSKKTITGPVIGFPITGPEAGEQVLKLAILLFDVKGRLNGGDYTEAWTAFFTGAVESYLRKNKVALVRYLPTTGGYLEITPETSPGALRDNPTLNRWFKSGDIKGFCALGGLYLRKTFPSEVIESYVELRVEATKVRQFMSGLGGVVGIARTQILPPSLVDSPSTQSNDDSLSGTQSAANETVATSRFQFWKRPRPKNNLRIVASNTELTGNAAGTNGHIEVGTSNLPPTA